MKREQKNLRSGFDDFIFYNPTGGTLNDMNDRYSILAYASQAITFGIGRSVNVGGPFDQSKQVDLQSMFGFTDAEWDHSAQFLQTNMVRHQYWEKVLETMGLSA